MNEQTTPGSGSTSGSGGDLHPAFNNPVSKPAVPPPEYHGPGRPQPTAPDRTRGHSPALDARGRQQQQPTGTQGAPGGEQHGDQGQGQQGQGQQGSGAVEIDGVSWSHDQVREAIAGRVEQDARKASLPQSANDYQIKLPPDFKPPEGVKFEFDQNDPGLKRARELAHARGVDQETFSDMLGVYAANKIAEQQQLGVARGTELAKLGSAAPGRIDAIETWLKARAGVKAGLLINQLRNYPVAAYVETFEQIIRSFTNQGGADFSQGGRQHEDNTGKIANYDNMNFAQKRAAQDAAAARGRGR